MHPRSSELSSMAPPHTTKAASSSRPQATTKHKQQKIVRAHKAVRTSAPQATRLNKAPLSGLRIASSRALSLQASDGRISKKRSRSKKQKTASAEGMLAGLQSLEDALPNTGPSNGVKTAASTGANGTSAGAKRKIITPRASLKSRPGAQKRRAAVERDEIKRFGLNLAVLASVKNEQKEAAGQQGSGGAPDATTQNNETTGDRWKALRNHIAKSLEDT